MKSPLPLMVVDLEAEGEQEATSDGNGRQELGRMLGIQCRLGRRLKSSHIAGFPSSSAVEPSHHSLTRIFYSQTQFQESSGMHIPVGVVVLHIKVFHHLEFNLIEEIIPHSE